MTKLGLHACHILDAPVLSFAWLGSNSRLASGEDGWETLLGSVPLGDPHTAATATRARWMLEVVSLNSLLSVGVAHEAMKSNALLGSRTYESWGWELTPKGLVETIGSTGDLKTAQLQLPQLGQGNRMILVFHLNQLQLAASAGQVAGRSRLELFLLFFDALVGLWRWQDVALPHELPDSLTNLRPAVSVDLGAAVRVLSSEVLMTDEE